MNYKKLGNALFWLSILSIPISAVIAYQVGEGDFFNITGFLRYCWIFWLFIPFSVASLFVGIKFKKTDLYYKRNCVVAYICIPLLTIFGFLNYIFPNVTYDTSIVNKINETTNIEIPTEVKVGNVEFTNDVISYVKITNTMDLQSFENEIKNSDFWLDKSNFTFFEIMTANFKAQTLDCEYFAFYNVNENEYNATSTLKHYKYIMFAYDLDLHRLIILNSRK